MKEAGSQTLCLDAPRPFNFYQTGADEMVPAPDFLSAASAVLHSAVLAPWLAPWHHLRTPA